MHNTIVMHPSTRIREKKIEITEKFWEELENEMSKFSVTIVKLRENWQGEKFDDKIIDGQKSDFYVDFNLKYNNKEVYNINRIAHTAK